MLAKRCSLRLAFQLQNFYLRMDTLASMNNLAEVLRNQGEYEAAEEMF